jgi:hypothetical protein
MTDMRYMTLLYDDEANTNEFGTPEFEQEMAGYIRFGEIAGDAIVAGEALEPASTARTVRRSPDGPSVTAGPYAEVTEVLGGFYVLEAASLDDAIELARQIPPVDTGAIEIRPMVQWIDSTPDAGSAGSPRWLCTIHGPETAADDPDDPAWAEGAAAHHRFGEAASSSLLAGGALHPTASATTIRRRDGELLVSDGPFSETTEVVGGVYLLAGDESSVMELAALIPVNDGGAVEVRPIMELDG